MDLQLKGKVVVITGGASGIGAAIVTGAAREGAIPVIADRCGEAAEQLAEQIRAGGGQALTVAVNLGLPQNCYRVVEETLDRFGRLDALVNNAGVNDRVGLEHGNAAGFMES